MTLFAGALHGAPADSPQTRTVRVTLTGATESGADITGTVMLRAMMGPLPPISLPVSSLTKPLTFTVPARTMWETSVEVKDWWAAPVVVAVQDLDAEVLVTLLPTGYVAGRLVAPEGGTAPKGLSVKVDVPPGKKKLPGPPSATTPCSVADDSTFSCEVPSGTLDLSFHAQGYVAVYEWGVKVETGARKELGPFVLSQGSAVSGFMVLAGKSVAPGKGKVALFIEAPGASVTASRLSRPITQALVAANGFFQLTDVPPGRYVLQASHPGFASSTLSPIQVYAHVETKIKRSIELQPPATLTLRVEPPTDYRGNDWLFFVMRASAINNRYEGGPVFNGASHEGVVVLRDQSGGRYRVTIADSSSNPFVAEEFTTAGAGDETHTFKPELVRVKGTLRRGENPLAATIWFGGRFGDKHVAVRSGDDGEFHGILPHAGQWRVVVNTETSETELGTDVTRAADDKESEVELKIPSNHVEGVVVDSSGQPLRLAVVRFTTDSDFATMHQTDANGHFTFDGVRPGPFTLSAEYETAAVMKSSHPHSSTIGDSDSIDGITLKVEDGRPLHGRVMGRDAPVIGADVTVCAGEGGENAPETNVTSGQEGIFDTSVAAGFDRALIAVQAPGYALRVFDVAIDGRAVTLNLPQAGGTLYVTAPKDANGLFFFQDGRFLDLASLIHWAQSRGEQFMDGKTFHVTEVAPGRYRACTLKQGSGRLADMTRCTEGFLAPYGELHLTIE